MKSYILYETCRNMCGVYNNPCNDRSHVKLGENYIQQMVKVMKGIFLYVLFTAVRNFIKYQD